MLTYKVLALALSYPTAEIQAALSEAGEALVAERLLPGPGTAALARLVQGLAETDLWDLQEEYVGLFDRQRTLSLHLYEHVHGESRDRGQAMVELAQVYKLHGLEITARELPDYLPLFLEFLSLLPAGPARAFLAEAAPIMAVLSRRHAERHSRWAAAFVALEALAGIAASPEAIAAVAATLPPEEDSLDALDRRWEEEAVRFVAAGPAGACGADVRPAA